MLSIKRSNSREFLVKYNSSKCFESESKEGANKTDLNEATDPVGSGDVNSSSSEPDKCQDHTCKEVLPVFKNQGNRRVKLFSAFGSLDELSFDAASPMFQPCQEEFAELVTVNSEDSRFDVPQVQMPEKFPLASLALLKNYRSRFRRLRDETINESNNCSTCTKLNGRKVSVYAIIRLAGESFIQSCSKNSDVSRHNHPYSSSLLGLSAEETSDVHLVGHLLASAEKVGQQKFDLARKLLHPCVELSSGKGNPVQRLVYYFCQALHEKIDRQTGRITLNSLGKQQLFDIEEAVMSSKSANVAFHKEVPFAQVSQFAGVQAIADHVAEAKRVHVIDLIIMNGSNSIALMQALAAREEHPLEHLKITAIGTKSKASIEETGMRLISFAESMNLSLSFKVIMVEDMLDLKEDLFELDSEEAVAVQSSYFLSTMIAQSHKLESLMTVIRKINPCVMVIIENEGNHNSPVFVNRFVEALLYYGAFFDSLEDCMDREDPNRFLLELVFFSPAIHNIVSAEGNERTVRHVTISIWRQFFARFGMLELELSTSSLYQASCIIEKFVHGSSCTLDRDGKCLIIGWKGTPIHSLSAWKFV